MDLVECFALSEVDADLVALAGDLAVWTDQAQVGSRWRWCHWKDFTSVCLLDGRVPDAVSQAASPFGAAFEPALARIRAGLSDARS